MAPPLLPPTRTDPPTSVSTHITGKAFNFLDTIAASANNNRPLAPGTFKPLVFSTGGLLARATADELRRWQGEMEPPVWDRMMTVLSLELLRARARTFRMGRGASNEDLL